MSIQAPSLNTVEKWIEKKKHTFDTACAYVFKEIQSRKEELSEELDPFLKDIDRNELLLKNAREQLEMVMTADGGSNAELFRTPVTRYLGEINALKDKIAEIQTRNAVEIFMLETYLRHIATIFNKSAPVTTITFESRDEAESRDYQSHIKSELGKDKQKKKQRKTRIIKKKSKRNLLVESPVVENEPVEKEVSESQETVNNEVPIPDPDSGNVMSAVHFFENNKSEDN